MKTAVKLLLLSLLTFSISNCSLPQAKDLNRQQTSELLQRFTELRLNYHLHSEQIPSNRQVLKLLADRSGTQLNSFKTGIKKHYPQIHNRLFGES